jgi:molybdate-binding protein
MLASGNPLGIRGICDLPATKARLINRQRGSGTRLAFDELLRTSGVVADTVTGYNTEEFTHLAVGGTVAGGLADVGFGVKAAASQFGLDFIPLIRENYFFACRNETLERAAAQRFVAMLGAEPFRNMVARLPGYDASASGEIVEIERALAVAPVRGARRARARSATWS